MAKRGAENQKTREGGDSDEEQIEDPGQRATPIAPVEGRVIRGMPKRKGLGGAAPSPAPPAPTPAASSTPFSGFSFGSSAPAPSNPFVFGGGSSASTPAQPAAPTPTSAAAPSNPFSGFSFAKPAASPAPAPTPAAEVAKPAAPAFGFGAKPAQPAAPTAVSSSPFAGFSFGTPAASAQKPAEHTTSAPAPAASTPFSFGTSSTPSSSTPVATPAAPSVTPSSAPTAQPSSTPATSSTSIGPVPSQPTPPPEGEVSYYTSLHGLNTSILSFLTSTIEQDQFTDLSVVLPSLVKQYETHLDEAATKAGWKPEGKKAAPSVNGELTKAVNGTSASTTFKMPSAPSAGGFALPKAPTANPTSSTPSFGGFTPTPSAAPSSGFTFGGAMPATTPAPNPAKTETPKKPSAEVTKLVEDVISGKPDEEKKEAPRPFTFGSSSTSTSTPDSKKTSSLFSFAPSGPLHPPTPESKTFSPSASLENATPAKLGKFGPGGSQPQLAFGGAKSSPGGQATPGTPAANKPSSFGFGFGSSSSSTAPAPASGGASFSFGSSSGTSAAPASGSSAPTFAFGSSASTASKAATTTPAFSFGNSSAPAAPSSTPSFSFGAKPATTSTAAPSSGFSFAPYTPKPAEGAGDEGNGDLPPENAEPSKNLAETTGAGEENEDTIVEQRGKLNKLDNGEFKLQGLGQFKLKRSKDGKKRRLLMRTDGSGNVILNMSVNGSFNPTVDGAHVKFLGFDGDGKPVPYVLRVKSAEVAKKIQEELQKEVEAIKNE
ncbi:hypothetical protein I302_105792 [Kwoniella bestiolae CBS 10118]|uniref:RanBD1 domain-containing protein n=1 Tax=Kwoniella bestiolae CBS 10118 TaxID=1296100 RepID=A0A1B9G251_9TREE|nr:hypothetical protein I302_04913 [Kwoniella bestiolae CBS 10118]OCF25103.1 hypothetical protein I302_04913 [Kwoniella bestiolae CBS 10118]